MAIRTELRDGNQVEVVGDDFAEVVRVFSPSISRVGVFLETDLWLPSGSAVRFRLGLADGFSLVHAVGEVAWRRPPSAGPPGLAIRFEHIVDGDALIERIVDQHQLEGGQPFQLSQDPASPNPEAVRALPTPLPATRQDRVSGPKSDGVDDGVTQRISGPEILETLDDRNAPKLAPGLDRAGGQGADVGVRLSREVIEALGGEEEQAPSVEPASVEPESPDPLLDQSVSDLRSLLGDAGARPDVLTSTVSGPPSRIPLGALRRRPGGGFESPDVPAATVKRPAARASGAEAAGSRGGARTDGPDDLRFDEAREASLPDRRRGRGDIFDAPLTGRLGEESGAEPAGTSSGQLHVDDPDALGGGAPADEDESDERSVSAPATDPLISASWLLDRWDRIAGEASGPPSEDPELVRADSLRADSVRGGGAARARGAAGFPLVPLLVLAVTVVAVYLALQRWYLDRPQPAPAPAVPDTGEVIEGASSEPEVQFAGAGRSLAEIVASPAASAPRVEVADGALDGPPAGVLQRVTWDLTPGETRILIEADGAFDLESIRHVRLSEGTPRELLRVAGILRPLDPPRYRIGSPQVAAVRFGFHQQGNSREAHLVVDLTDATARLRLVRLAPRRMVLVVAGNPR
ncbi:MAG TPA: PilZ domain-containing protein [Thermoanaerobaculia bacterium]|nr:PilZ domain-containing protein [Thermoanaerobaculia bacterium]